MSFQRPPSLPAWAWVLVLLWGPCVVAAMHLPETRAHPDRWSVRVLFAAVFSALAWLAAVALRRMLQRAQAEADLPYVVRHGGLMFGAGFGAMQVASKLPWIGDASPGDFVAMLLFHATTLAPFALWGGVLWQAGMRWFMPPRGDGKP